MKLILCIVAVSLILKEIIGAPLKDEKKPVVEIVEQAFNHFPDGGYSFKYVTSDGQTKEERGYYRYVDDVPILTIEGSYSYIGDYGVQYIVRYKADENGYNVDDKVPINNLSKPPIPSEEFNVGILALPPNIAASLVG